MSSVAKLEDLSKAELIEQNRLLQLQVKALMDRVEELEKRLNKNSRNSSKSPSSDLKPLKKPRKRNVKKGPPEGHQGNTRHDFGEPDHVQNCFTDICHCGHPLETTGTDYQAFQVAELHKPVVVTEYRCFEQTCSSCGLKTKAALPEEVIPGQSIGPELQSWLSYLHVYHHISYAKLEQMSQTLFGIPMSQGTLSTLFQKTKTALKSAYDLIQARVQQSESIHCDETGWKLSGKRKYLFLATTKSFSYYWTADQRSRLALRVGIGEDYAGAIHSDFFSIYSIYPGQGCWAHLQRDVESSLESNDAAERIFAQELRIYMNLIWGLWREYDQGRLPQEGFQYLGRLCRGRLEEWLKHQENLSRAAKNLKARFEKYSDKMFYFVEHPQTPPDNNLAERDLRPLVVNRKISGGNRSSWGESFKTSLMSVVMTCRKQGRDVIDYLKQALLASSNPSVQYPILFNST